MVTIRYRLTPKDLAELEEVRRGGILLRILRIPTGAFIGFLGLFGTWHAIFFFPWNHWIGNLVIACLGILLLWMGLEMPGLKWLSERFFDPNAESEVQIYEGKIVSSCRGKTRQLRWFPLRGFRERGQFFFVRARDAEFAIPKHVVTPDQVKELRELLQHAAAQQTPAHGDDIECSFFLTQDELTEASTSQGWFQCWLKTRPGRVLAQGFCGLGALWLLWVPRHIGKSWAEAFRADPGATVILVGFSLLSLFAAAGCPGLKALNRLHLQRRIRISHQFVEETRGSKTSTHPWKRFFSYHETPNLFVLHTQIVALILTIPKKSLQPGDEEKLRALLDSKLPKQ
jgi:hypothetical protein